MKSKISLAIIATVVLSGILLTVVAFAANQAGGAYEQFKKLFDREHVKFDNATANVTMSVTDNGQRVLGLEGSMKRDSVGDRMSGTLLISGKEKTESFEVYCNSEDDLFRLAGSDKWYRTTHSNEDREEGGDRRFDGNAEERDIRDSELKDAVLDTVFGSYRDQFSVVESNGQRTFTLRFSENNMPILLQTMFQLSDMRENDNTRDGSDCNDDLSVLPQELQDAFSGLIEQDHAPELVEKKLEKLEMSFTVDEQDRVTGISLAAECSGTDAGGTAHELDIALSVSLTDIGTTVVDEADPDPASNTVIEKGIFRNAGK